MKVNFEQKHRFWHRYRNGDRAWMKKISPVCCVLGQVWLSIIPRYLHDGSHQHAGSINLQHTFSYYEPNVRWKCREHRHQYIGCCPQSLRFWQRIRSVQLFSIISYGAVRALLSSGYWHIMLHSCLSLPLRSLTWHQILKTLIYLNHQQFHSHRPLLASENDR